MIVNLGSAGLLLDRSEFNFYLTGSRFFKTESPISDFDYFVQDSQEVRNFLHDNSFHTVGALGLVPPQYLDEQTVNVVYRDDIHIQLVKDVTVKHQAQELLRFFPELMKELEPPFFGSDLEGPKDRRSLLWNRLYDYVSNNK